MARLVILQGPNAGRQFALADEASIIGRQPDAQIYLDSLSVSRQHARVHQQGTRFYVEDAGSSNGTFLNGKRLAGRSPLTERDTLQIGPYIFGLRPEPTPTPRPPEPEPIISAQVSVLSANHTLFSQNPAQKLRVVLEIAQSLAHALEVDQLLGKLLEQLFRLFPQADRGLVLLTEHERLVVRARYGDGDDSEFRFSRSIVQRALQDGIGILSEDIGGDQNLVKTETLISLKLRSLLCVPLIVQERRLGAIQLDCSRPGAAFRADDLELLTAVGIQVAVVLENAALHAERLREERFRQELAMAREIQQGFLPTNFAPVGPAQYELYARIHPAREVSGDLYDFFPLSDGRLAFFVGDVSGKGMPAALFMIAVRTLCRHLAPLSAGPADTLTRLNTALATDNPGAMFVTMAHGIFDPANGDVVLTLGGHPLPLLRRVDGRVEELKVPSGRLIGALGADPRLTDNRFRLEPGETLILYTDGFTEATPPGRESMFEVEGLSEVLGGPRTALSLEQCADEARAAIERYTGSPEQQDDLTLLLLRRLPQS